MRLDDWRTASSDELAPCFAAERARWAATLGWETAPTFKAVESARSTGSLPGFLLRDEANAICGWSFHLLHRGELQLGSLVTPSTSATTQMFEALLQSPEAQRARKWMAFGWFNAPGLSDQLSEYGAEVESYHYLSHDLPSPVRHETKEQAASLRAWRTEDDVQLAPLLSSAYDGPDAARPFAANGTMSEWIEYAAHLLHGSACGTFAPEISRVCVQADQIDGAAVMTRLMPTTAHLAQLAVRREAQRRGLGERLLVAALDAASAAGDDRVTLLVRDSNETARQLYSRLGFAERAQFLSATSVFSRRLSAAS